MESQRTEIARYTNLDGEEFEVEYDPDAPCWMCGLPVVAASMGGTVVCPWCDCGNNRDGSKWSLEETNAAFARFRENSERTEHEAAERIAAQTATKVEPGPLLRPSELSERLLTL